MTSDLSAGIYKIISLIGDSPVGVNDTKPPFQFIYLNAPVTDVRQFLVSIQNARLTSLLQWKFTMSEAHTYQFTIDGYPYIGVLDDKVIATVDRGQSAGWTIVHEDQDAYTYAALAFPRRFSVLLICSLFSIRLAKDPSQGWTVADDSPHSKAIYSLPLARQYF